MKVTGFRNGESGCDFYRCVLPMLTAYEHKGLTYKETWAEKIIADIVLDTERFKNNMDSDILLLQRISTLKFIDSLKKYRDDNGLKTKIVMDFDDNCFNISPLSNHYKEHGTQEFKIDFPDGSSHYAWKDGVDGFSISENKIRIHEIKRVLASADLVTTTTPILADVFREFNPKVKVLPNCVDLSIWNKLPLVKDEKQIRLYWGGGMSHWEDLVLIREPLKEIFSKYSNAKIVMLGWMPEGFEQTYPGRVEFRKWSNFHAYPYEYASLGIDIALIPLVDNEFNRCKSNIKWIEASSLQIPSVVSYCSPYKEVESLSDKDLAVFIDGNNPAAWVKGISMLIDNPDLRKKIGEESRMVVEKHFDINTQYHKWIDAYSEVLDASSNTRNSN